MNGLGNNIITDTKYKPKYRLVYFTENDGKKFFLENKLYGICIIS